MGWTGFPDATALSDRQIISRAVQVTGRLDTNVVRISVFIFCIVITIKSAPGYTQYVLNNTEQTIAIRVVINGKRHDLTLKPHWRYCQSVDGQVIERLRVIYRTGSIRDLSKSQIAYMREKKTFKNELWVITLNSIELYDLRRWREFENG